MTMPWRFLDFPFSTSQCAFFSSEYAENFFAVRLGSVFKFRNESAKAGFESFFGVSSRVDAAHRRGEDTKKGPEARNSKRAEWADAQQPVRRTVGVPADTQNPVERTPEKF